MSEAPTTTTSEAPAAAPAAPAPQLNVYPEAAPAAAEAPAAEAPAETKAETPPAEEVKPEGEAKPEAEAAQAAVEVNLPEGFEVKTEVLDKFKGLAAEAGLSNEAAQKLVDLYVSESKATVDSLQSQWNTTIDGWKAELDAIPEFSGEKREAAQTLIGRALDEYGSPEARQAFDLTGAGWNPHIVQMFYKMAQALSEGGPVAIGRPAGQPATTAQRLYPNSQ